jgi:hydroxyacylglutathione hydrolase
MFPWRKKKMQQVAQGVYFIPGQDGMMPDCHSYLIGEPASGDLSLVDAGMMGKKDYKIQSILKAGINLKDIKRVIMTHTHLDHMGCLPEILEDLTGAEIWMHKDEADPLEKGDESIAYCAEMFAQMIRTMFRKKPGDYCLKVARKLNGDETLEIGGMVWEAVHLPGHSPGGLGLYNPAGKILIPGDVVYADHAIGRFDFCGASGRALNDSLMTLAALDVDILLPGHNRIVNKLPKQYILETARTWEAHLVG